PYKSSPPALTDVIAGRVSMMFVDVLTGLPHVNGKALKALAVTTKQPSALLPHLPTMDATVKGFDITSWQGYFGPANLPKEMVTRLNAEIRKVVERPDIKSQLAERGMEAFSSTPEEFDAFLKAQLVLWEKLIADAGIEKQQGLRRVPDEEQLETPLRRAWTRILLTLRGRDWRNDSPCGILKPLGALIRRFSRSPDPRKILALEVPGVVREAVQDALTFGEQRRGAVAIINTEESNGGAGNAEIQNTAAEGRKLPRRRRRLRL